MNKFTVIAKNLAKEAHKGQTRNNGKPYFTHCRKVALTAKELVFDYFDPRIFPKDSKDWAYHDMGDKVEQIGYLHDTLEDTNLEYNTIKKELGDIVAIAVNLLTKQKGISYFDFINNLVCHKVSKRISLNNSYWSGSIAAELAKIVKLADLQDNMSDLKEGSLKDKYRFAEEKIIKSFW